MFKIATWNVNSLRVRLPQVLDWLQNHQPDVLCLQETKVPDELFPVQAFAERGYHAVFSGQKTFNGVATLTRMPAETEVISTDFPDHDDSQKRVLCAKINDICILNVYVPNGSEVGSDKYAYKLEWLSRLRAYSSVLVGRFRECIVLGDFNIAPADRDVHDPEEWSGKILCSDAERQAYSRLLDTGLKDCFRIFPQPDGSFTWWDYRAAGFRRNRGLRIDHILASVPMAKRCTECRIDSKPRSQPRPSDHAPVFAGFDL